MMHVFVTGATGWVGSAVVKELIAGGHRVTGLVRAPQKAEEMARAGATALLGTLDDLELLRSGASRADAVIHTAWGTDYSRFVENSEQDRRAIDALGAGLEGSGRPLLVTSGLLALPARAGESELPDPASPRKSELTARHWATRGVRAATVRLAPSVHGAGEHGFLSLLIRMAKEKGISAYLEDGQNCWAGVHRDDAARVFRLALERGVPLPVYHAVSEEGVPFHEIAEVIGRQLRLPVGRRGPEHFGWFTHFAGATMSASSRRTQEVLAWTPSGPSLSADLTHPDYYA